MLWLAWKSSLGPPPNWALGKCIWWSAAPCGAAASRWGWSRRWETAAASSVCRGGRGGRRAACSPGPGAQQSRSTRERGRFTGERSQGELGGGGGGGGGWDQPRCFLFKAWSKCRVISLFMGMYRSKWKDIPQLELLLRIVLNHKTWPSGHRSFPQKKESTATVRAAETKGIKTIIVHTLSSSKTLFIQCTFTTHPGTGSRQEPRSKAAAAAPASCSAGTSTTWDPWRCWAPTGTRWWLKQRGWWSGHISEPSKMWTLQELGKETYCHHL